MAESKIKNMEDQRTNLKEIGRVEQCQYCQKELITDDVDMYIICCEDSKCISQAQRQHCQ